MSRGQNKTQEMSVEEILNSIRRVIGDETLNGNTAPATTRTPSANTEERSEPTLASDEDILELTTPIYHPQQSGGLRKKNATPEAHEGFLSNETINRTTEQIDTLISKLDTAVSSTANTQHKSIDELVINTLKPELKQWLDKNLPGLVTTIVRQEINKIISKAKS